MIYVIRQYDGWSSGATPKVVAFALSKEAADDYIQMRNYQGAGQLEYEYSTERVLNDEDDKLRVELGILHKAVDDLTGACADTGDVMQRLRAENERLRGALTRFAEHDNWRVGNPDSYGGTNYEWIGDDDEPFEMAAAALREP